MTPFLKRFRTLFIGATSENRNLVDEQRRMAFVYGCLAMLFADVVLWFLGMSTFEKPLYEIVHPVHFALAFALLLSYLRGRLPATTGVTILCMANQLAIIFEMGVCLMAAGPLRGEMIIGYMVMAGLNMSLVLMAYVRVQSFVLGGLTMAAYGACCWVSGEESLTGMFPIFLACFLVIALSGHQMSDNVHRLEREKSALKEDEQKILNLLELDKSQLAAYISMAREKGLSAEQTGILLDIVGKKARDNIRDNVSYYLRQREIDYAGLQACLPELTRSEVEICELILKDKKLKEMLRILGKSEGNVTSQRSNIRRKLGLDRSADLREELRKRTMTD